jgi:hypothetical protein
MNRNWHELLEQDTRARWVIAGISMAVSAAVGFLSDVNGLTFKLCEALAAVSGAVVFLALGFVYVSGPKRKKMQKAMTGFRFFATVAFILLCVTCAVLAVSKASPVVFAAVANQQLRAAVKPDAPAGSERRAQRVLLYAVKTDLELDPSLVDAALSKEAASSDTSVWAAYVQALSEKWNRPLSNWHPKNFTDPNKMLANPSTPYSSMTLDIDGWAGEYIDFDSVAIVYRGGPINIKNFRFKNVNFHIANNENGRKFADALRSSRDGNVTITLN